MPGLESLSSAVGELSLDHERPRERQEDDHDRAADELGRRELPTHQDDEHDAELDHEVGRREHEDHRGDEVGALLEQRLAHRGRRVGARRRHHAQPARARDGARAMVAHDPFHLLARRERLDRARQREAEDQRPERLPEHEEALAQAVPDVASSGATKWVIASRPRLSRLHESGDGGGRLGDLVLRGRTALADRVRDAQCSRWASSSSSATACRADSPPRSA